MINLYNADKDSFFKEYLELMCYKLEQMSILQKMQLDGFNKVLENETICKELMNYVVKKGNNYDIERVYDKIEKFIDDEFIKKVSLDLIPIEKLNKEILIDKMTNLYVNETTKRCVEYTLNNQINKYKPLLCEIYGEYLGNLIDKGFRIYKKSIHREDGQYYLTDYEFSRSQFSSKYFTFDSKSFTEIKEPNEDIIYIDNDLGVKQKIKTDDIEDILKNGLKCLIRI